MFCVGDEREEGPIMKNINAFAVGMRAAGAAWAFRAASGYAVRPAHAAATAHATAPAAAAQRKRRTASTAFVDGGII
jgi:hypothetical protein